MDCRVAQPPLLHVLSKFRTYFRTNSSPEGRGWPEGPGEGCKDSSLHPSPGASHHPLPSGEGWLRHKEESRAATSSAQTVWWFNRQSIELEMDASQYFRCRGHPSWPGGAIAHLTRCVLAFVIRAASLFLHNNRHRDHSLIQA